MIARHSDGVRPELELAGNADEWVALAELLDEGGCEVPCVAGQDALKRVHIVREDRPLLFVSVSADGCEGTITASPEGIERLARSLRVFASKSRGGQDAHIENMGPDHYVDPGSLLLTLRMTTAAPHRGDVGG